MKNMASTFQDTAAGMIKTALAGFAAALLLAASPCFADEDNERARAMVQKGEFIPLVEIIKRVQNAQQGDVLEVEIYEEDGRTLYELDVLDRNDELHEVMVDPYTGEIVRMAPHR